MTPKLAKRLFDAQKACESAIEFCHGKTEKDYEKDLMLRSAVERQLEILGEALKMAMAEDLEFEGKIPEARRIVGIRNRIIHGYDCVDDEIIWDVVTRKLAPLAKILAKQLAG